MAAIVSPGGPTMATKFAVDGPGGPIFGGTIGGVTVHTHTHMHTHSCMHTCTTNVYVHTHVYNIHMHTHSHTCYYEQYMYMQT